MQRRQLGPFNVSAIGLGCMSMSQSYGKANRQESERALHRALDLGYNFLDTASLYGLGHNETLIGQVLGARRQEFVLASKCGIVVRDGKRAVDCTPANVKRTCEDSLKRLQTDCIDLYYLHRRDFNVPIEDSVGALAEMVKAGKIRHVGLSECSAETIRRAHREHPIAAVQSEYSLWSREPEFKVLAACRELNIGFVPFSPLGRAFLTGAITDLANLEPDDMRQTMPRFTGKNFVHNLAVLSELKDIAQRNHCSTAQLSLAWLLAQGETLVPIPGSKHVSFVEENAAAADLQIPAAELDLAGELFVKHGVHGDRYAPSHMISLDPD